MSSLLSKSYEDSKKEQDKWEKHLKEEKQKEEFEKSGAGLIMKERSRQIEVEGYTKQHDLRHNEKEFMYAALAYLLESICKGTGISKWCWDKIYFKPKDTLRNLIRAGALIAAAIDRINYNSNKL